MLEKMSLWGVGPLFALWSLGYSALVLVISHYFHLRFEINFIPREFLVIIAIILLIIGIPFFIVSIFALHGAYNSGKLITTGIFKYCRNPIYAAWVVFLVLAIVLLRGEWLGMTVPVFMYIALRILVRKEEDYLTTAYGQAYLDYKKRVMCVLPLSWLKK